MKNILEIKNLNKQFKKGNVVLNDINLTVEEGEFIAIMGPSGSGKTTLLNIIATMDSLTSGSALINGLNVSLLKEKEMAEYRGQKLGFIFQDYNLIETLTVRENIALPLAIKKLKVEQITEKVETIAKKLGIDQILESYPMQISGGQQQRVSIARAFIKNPEIIMADEPTGALDSKSSKVVLEALANFNQEFNQTIICVTHDGLAASYANKVLFIKDGKIQTSIEKNGKSEKSFHKQILEVISEVIEV